MIKFLDLQRINQRHEAEFKEALAGVLDSGWYIRGRQLSAFESEFAKYCGVPHAIGTGNGLDALILILKAWMQAGKIEAGDEVLVPANTYIASILSISACGLVPVPVEPDPQTCNIDPGRLQAAMGRRTRVLMAVHLYGQLADMKRLSAFAKEKGLLLLEDAAQAHGARDAKGRRAGSFGDAAAFSFYPGKNLGALGDGGAVVTPDAELARLVRALGNYGSEKKYVHRMKGINSRLDELQAAFLRIKLRSLDADNERRREIARQYLEGIHHPELQLPHWDGSSAHVFHLFVIRHPARDKLAAHLRKKGVETAIHYPLPPHRQGAYREWNERKFPLTEAIHREVLSLPIHPLLQEEEIRFIIQSINQFS